MKVEVSSQGAIVLKEVYNEIILQTREGEELSICMRDSGFEFFYSGHKYEAKEGEVFKTPIPLPKKSDIPQSNV